MLLTHVFNAGIVGCGGAGFPTHVKLNCQAEYMIINGAECEPLLNTDKYLMRHFAKEVVSAAEKCGNQVGAKHVVIAIKDYYEAENAALSAAIAELGSRVEIFLLHNYYPAGDEQMIVYEVTGRVVPPGGIPIAVGAVVSNVATMLAVSEAVDGQPLIHKYMTIGGDVPEAVLLRVPVGMPLAECLAAAGVRCEPGRQYILGGPMMGRYMYGEDLAKEVVTKTTSGILVLPAAAEWGMPGLQQMINRARSACIQCHYCTDLCPRHLLGHPLRPHMIMRKMATAGAGVSEEMLQDPDIQNAAICCECGVCERFACPMGLAPRSINSALKKKLGAAGIRYKSDGLSTEPLPFREYRIVPAPSMTARLGLARYMSVHPDECIEVSAAEVQILLKQHVGAPAKPCVSEGDRVSEGQLIAAPPEGALGAKIHSSIDGIVDRIEADRIIIRSEVA